jgi:hypothetical protein
MHRKNLEHLTPNDPSAPSCYDKYKEPLIIITRR